MNSVSIVYYLDCWGVGGIERFVISSAKCMKKKGYSPAVFASYATNDELNCQLTECDIPLFVALPEGQKLNLVTRTLRTLKPWFDYLKTYSPNVVHINIMNGVGFLYAALASNVNVKKRIVHSHNADVGSGHRRLKRLISHISAKCLGCFATKRVACSVDAGTFLFKNQSFELVRNSIDINKFRFSQKGRSKFRERFCIGEDCVLLGNPSRLAPAKNPLFTLEVFNSYRRRCKAKLLLSAAGSMRDTVQRAAFELGLADDVIFIPPQADMQELYSALDVLVFPSIHEGLPFVLIEAQCSGLPVIASDEITLEGKVLSSYCTLPLGDAELWASAICSLNDLGAVGLRGQSYECLRNAGFDASSLAKQLIDLYS